MSQPRLCAQGCGKTVVRGQRHECAGPCAVVKDSPFIYRDAVVTLDGKPLVGCIIAVNGQPA